MKYAVVLLHDCIMDMKAGDSTELHLQSTWFRPAYGQPTQFADFAAADSEVSLRFEALDGTAGMTGPRTWLGACCRMLATCTAPKTCLSPSSGLHRPGYRSQAHARTLGHAGPDPDGRPFPDPTEYLSPAELASYNRWVRWSVKPNGLDYLQPRPEYFRQASRFEVGCEPAEPIGALILLYLFFCLQFGENQEVQRRCI